MHRFSAPVKQKELLCDIRADNRDERRDIFLEIKAYTSQVNVLYKQLVRH